MYVFNDVQVQRVFENNYLTRIAIMHHLRSLGFVACLEVLHPRDYVDPWAEHEGRLKGVSQRKLADLSNRSRIERTAQLSSGDLRIVKSVKHFLRRLEMGSSLVLVGNGKSFVLIVGS